MSAQLNIEGTRGVGANGRPLTRNQELVWSYVTVTDGGITADEAGAWLHAHRARRPHSVDVRCIDCARDGRSVLQSAALGPLLIRRRGSGRYEPRDPADRVRVESVQSAVLPGSSFEDIFNGSEAA